MLEDLHHLPYTLRVIKEVLRLYPPAPFYVRDSIAEDELGGFNTQGLPVLMSPYYTHRHPAFWENPLEFNPDRWTPEQEADRHPYAYHPFAAGQRVCIGNNFSLLESHILLSLLAREYAPRMVPGFTPPIYYGRHAWHIERFPDDHRAPFLSVHLQNSDPTGTWLTAVCLFFSQYHPLHFLCAETWIFRYTYPLPFSGILSMAVLTSKLLDKFPYSRLRGSQNDPARACLLQGWPRLGHHPDRE